MKERIEEILNTTTDVEELENFLSDNEIPYAVSDRGTDAEQLEIGFYDERSEWVCIYAVHYSTTQEPGWISGVDDSAMEWDHHDRQAGRIANAANEAYSHTQEP